MKKLMSIVLSALMLVTVVSTFGVMNAAAVTEISNASPAITADVGEKVDLTTYSVVFDGELKATSELSWRDANGNAVTEVTPDAKGVTKLTAVSNGKSKTIYLVAKEKDEKEYVLYEADFSKYSSLDELKNEGFVTTDPENYYAFTDGALVMGNGSHDYVRLIFPEWLGEFGNYSITTDAKMVDVANDSRWFGMVYRIQNENKEYYPYYHMCVRANTTVSNGIEFAERTSKNAWNVAVTAAGSISSLLKEYHTFNIQAFGTDVQYNIDGYETVYVNDSIISSGVPYYTKGMVGLTMNMGRVSVKSVRIAVQENTPVRGEKKLNLINNPHESNNIINTLANVESISSADSLGKAGSVMIKVSDIADLDAFVLKCVESQTLPTFVVSSEDEVNKLDSAMTGADLRDANAVSESASLLAQIRAKQPIVRTGLIVDINDGGLDPESANEIRLAVRSAPATFCVIPVEDALYTSVDELQELAVAVWVTMDAKADSDEFTVQALKALTSGANGIVSASASALTKVINDYFEENTMTRTPVMIGHRGNPSQAPENSLSGFIKAYENGADVFEVDVEITKDGEIVIMHDSTLNRTTNYTGKANVNQMTLEEIKKYNLKALDGSFSDEKVPTLREVFEEFKDKDCKIFVEFKGGNAANIKTTCELIKEYGMEEKVDVISFNVNFLMQTQTHIPGMATGFLHSPSGSVATAEDALDIIYASLASAQKYNSSINPSRGVATRHFMQAAVDRGMTVWPWTYTSSTNNGAFLSGCDGVTTDDMQWVTNMVKYITASDVEVAEGQSVSTGVTAVTYGNKESEINGNDLIVKVIDGDEFVTIEDGNITGVKTGVATVMYGFKTKTTADSDYVVYTQPVSINVVVPAAEAPVTDGNNDSRVIIIVVSAVVLLAAGIVTVLLAKKKK